MFQAGEEVFDLAKERSVRLRIEQGDKLAEEDDARGRVGMGRSIQTQVRGENPAGFPLPGLSSIMRMSTRLLRTFRVHSFTCFLD